MNIYISLKIYLFINVRKYIFGDTIFKVYLPIINAVYLYSEKFKATMLLEP